MIDVEATLSEKDRKFRENLCGVVDYYPSRMNF